MHEEAAVKAFRGHLIANEMAKALFIEARLDHACNPAKRSNRLLSYVIRSDDERIAAKKRYNLLLSEIESNMDSWSPTKLEESLEDLRYHAKKARDGFTSLDLSRSRKAKIQAIIRGLKNDARQLKRLAYALAGGHGEATSILFLAPVLNAPTHFYYLKWARETIKEL